MDFLSISKSFGYRNKVKEPFLAFRKDIGNRNHAIVTVTHISLPQDEIDFTNMTNSEFETDMSLVHHLQSQQTIGYDDEEFKLEITSYLKPYLLKEIEKSKSKTGILVCWSNEENKLILVEAKNSVLLEEEFYSQTKLEYLAYSESYDNIVKYIRKAIMRGFVDFITY